VIRQSNQARDTNTSQKDRRIDGKSPRTGSKAHGSTLASFKKTKISRNYFSGENSDILRSMERHERAQIFNKIVDTTTNKLMNSYA
jgi:hypothetical protein